LFFKGERREDEKLSWREKRKRRKREKKRRARAGTQKK
jgi:hypothetical protein